MDKPTVRIEVFMITAGQPRRYADSVYEANLVFSNWWQSTTGPRKGNWEPDEKMVRQLAKMFVHDFLDNPTWVLDSKLELIERVSPGVWHVKIREPYAD